MFAFFVTLNSIFSFFYYYFLGAAVFVLSAGEAVSTAAEDPSALKVP
jgi:hypothetical protein